MRKIITERAGTRVAGPDEHPPRPLVGVDGGGTAVLTWTSVVTDEAHPAEVSVAVAVDRRADLSIRPLTEFPALRRALGIDGEVLPAVPAADLDTPAHRVARSFAKHAASRQAQSRRTATAAKARRFDRRALLESA